MLRNSRYIGNTIENITAQTAEGIRDTFDVYKNNLSYPKRKVITGDNFSGTTRYRGMTNQIAVFTTDGFAEGETLYLTVSHATTNASDFYIFPNNSTVSGSQVSFSMQFTLDTSTVSVEYFYLQVRTGSTAGPVIYTTASIYLAPCNHSLYALSSSYNEGSSATFNYSANIANSTIYYSTNLGTTDVSPTSGSFYYTGGTYQFSISALADYLTEGGETLTVSIRAYSTVGTVLTSASTTINDTSKTPSASVSVSNMNENANMTVNVSTTNFTSGTLYWEIVNVLNGEPDSDFTASTGSFTVSSSAGSFIVTSVADGYTEGTESFKVDIKLADGTVIGSSGTFNVSDTSTGTPEPAGIDITGQFVPISEFVVSDNSSNTTANFSVGEVQQNSNVTGRLYLAHKATGITTYYNDVPIAAIQIIDAGGNNIVEQWYFGVSGNGAGWTTDTIQRSVGAIGSGITVTPSFVSTNYSFATSVVNGATANRFCLATSTGSASTGANDGIALPSAPLTVGNATTPQAFNTYYMYRETSGATVPYVCFCRSPSRTWSPGERIRVAYIIGNVSTANYYTPTDTLFVGIAP